MVDQDEVGSADRRAVGVQWVGATSNEERWVRFGAVMMVIVGAFSVIEGLVALFAPTTYRSVNGTVIAIDFVVWGWVHLVVGALVLLTGVVLLRDDAPGWARLAGMLVVGLCMVVQLAWLPAQPVWSILMVGLAVLVLRALTLTWSDRYTGVG
jgi:hypothetical protein